MKNMDFSNLDIFSTKYEHMEQNTLRQKKYEQL
jgi:hypothetical protein